MEISDATGCLLDRFRGFQIAVNGPHDTKWIEVEKMWVLELRISTGIRIESPLWLAPTEMPSRLGWRCVLIEAAYHLNPINFMRGGVTHAELALLAWHTFCCELLWWPSEVRSYDERLSTVGIIIWRCMKHKHKATGQGWIPSSNMSNWRKPAFGGYFQAKI